MRYVIIIPDGGADYPLDDLDGKTALEAASIPNTDKLAATGRLGTAVTTPKGMPCGSDTCSMCLLGYDPARYHTGRAPLEAAALGIELAPTDWIFRVNLVTVIDGLMQDHSGGAIRSDEGRQLLETIEQAADFPGATFHPGVSYRNILVDRSGERDWSRLITTPPHDIPGEPISRHLPSGAPDADLLVSMIETSEQRFAEHDVNLTRREMGETPATHVWPWGQGIKPDMPAFSEVYGRRGAMITAVDLLAGIASLIGWERLDVPGQTSYHDTDYAAAGKHAIKAIDDYDLVCVHIEAPDEASHAGDAATKVAALEAIDRHVVGPIHEALVQRGEDWRILIMPDHFTRVETRKHDPTPVPFLIAGHKMNGVVERVYTEAAANEADLKIAHGHELMEFFLDSGVR
ncbi:cofactor-independent phosphoglycerate mutase [Mucisphaera calidilacus]|uniref:Cofactor-independent phosphoglycerate mutase n=1 Tax=Mucisphaera calidilacus TaxID=2527982 RepID=A0A518BZ15_9BACT|nr:cofactor-independent phosphoglycerate mutase [Mucisphaera calidilacus]QDU72213.1 cofactor-independent phosphoglycerate mutase [Mucisphaera calidilacus]